MNSITLNVHSERNLQLTKSCVQRKNNGLRSFDNSIKFITPRVRRHLSCEDCIPSYRQSVVKGHALKSHIWKNSSEFYGNNSDKHSSAFGTEIKQKEELKTLANSKRSTRGKSANTDCPKLSKAKFDNSLLDVKDSVSEWVNEASRHLKPRTVCVNEVDTKNTEKPLSRTQSNEKKSFIKIPEKRTIRNEFLNFENCCCELLLNSKYSQSNSYKTALNFYKLLLTLYHSIQVINKKYFKDIDKSKEIELSIDTSAKVHRSKIEQNMDIVTNSTNKSVEKFSDKTIKSIAMKGLKSGDDFGSQLNKVKNQLLNLKDEDILKFINPNIDLHIPLRVDNDKLRIGELLSFPKVCIKSKSVVRIYKEFVEEQYLISALRGITKGESLNLSTMDTDKSRSGSVRYKNITAACTLGTAGFHFHSDQSIQTTLENQQNTRLKLHKVCHVSSQTNTAQTFGKNSKISLNIMDEKAETLSWRSDYLSNDEFYSKMESKVTSPVPFADVLVDNVGYEMWEKKQVGVEYVETKSSSIDGEIPVFSSWTVHGVKVRCIFNRAVESVTKSNIAVGDLKKCNARYNRKDKDQWSCNEARVTTVKDVLANSALPPYSPSKISTKSTIKVDKDGVETPIPESLNSLYERLAKLQKLLEQVPEENISSTIDALEHLDSMASNSPEVKELINQPKYPTSLGDCSEHGSTTRSIKTQGDMKSIFPKMGEECTKCNNEIFLDDDGSDATTSLSMLENLIDDFLSKNGISNLSNI